jgi:hypothetical protein
LQEQRLRRSGLLSDFQTALLAIVINLGGVNPVHNACPQQPRKLLREEADGKD